MSGRCSGIFTIECFEAGNCLKFPIVPPIIILIGLSAAGKSTVALAIEEIALAGRVRRYTTRKPRFDDDPSLVVCRTNLDAGDDDFEYPGWGDDSYLIQRADIEHLQHAGVVPIIELGDIETAISLASKFRNSKIILVRRRINQSELVSLFRSRGMGPAEIEERLGSLAEDGLSLTRRIDDVDYIVDNSGDLHSLQEKFKELCVTLGIPPRR